MMRATPLILVVTVGGCVSPAVTPARDPEVRSAVHALVTAIAQREGVPAHLAHGIVRTESNYNPRAYNQGTIGLGQIKCQTARGLGFTGACGDLYDAATNLKWSMRYLRLALDRGGETCAGLSLYQSGIYAKPRCSAYGSLVLTRTRRP